MVGGPLLFVLPLFSDRSLGRFTPWLSRTRTVVFPTDVNADVGCFAVFLLLPSEIRLRSQAVGAEGFFGVLMEELHKADTPYNAWPSLHVLQVYSCGAFVRHALMKQERWSMMLAMMAWSACSLLVASTVLIKQHYVFDALSSIAIVAISWRWWIEPALN